MHGTHIRDCYLYRSHLPLVSLGLALLGKWTFPCGPSYKAPYLLHGYLSRVQMWVILAAMSYWMTGNREEHVYLALPLLTGGRPGLNVV